MPKRALLIGVNDYPLLGPLRYAEADAEGVAGSLKRNYGFEESEIILMTSQKPGILRPSKAFIETQLQYIRETTRNLDFLLVGFWGHGRLSPDQSRRYLCLSDSNTENLRDTALTFEFLNGYLKEIGAQNTCLILDCCQTIFNRGDNQAMTEAESVNLSRFAEQTARDIKDHRDHLGMPYTPPTFAILNACMAGQQAYEWDERQHGIFTAHLLDGMEQKLDSVGRWSRYVSVNVPITALKKGQRQTPFFKQSGAGDIVLINIEEAVTDIVTTPPHLSETTPIPPVMDKKVNQRKFMTLKCITAVATILVILSFISNKLVPPSHQSEDFSAQPVSVEVPPPPSKTDTASAKQAQGTAGPTPPSKTDTASAKQAQGTAGPTPPPKTDTVSAKQAQGTAGPPPPSKTDTASAKQAQGTAGPPPPSKTDAVSAKQAQGTAGPPPPSKTDTASAKQAQGTAGPPPPPAPVNPVSITSEGNGVLQEDRNDQ